MLCFFSMSILANSKDIIIEITQGIDSKIPVVIVPFDSEEALPSQYLTQPFSTIIQNDLNRSGLFQAIIGYEEIDHNNPAKIS